MNGKKIIVNRGKQPTLGLTTNTFMKFIKNDEITNEQIIKWAHDYGFSWVELRDPGVSMNKEYLRQLKDVGDILNIRLHYAWDCNDLLHPNDAIFFSGIERACIFGEKTYSRVLIAPDSIKNIADKKGYTQAEFQQILPMIEKYTTYAAEKGIIVCFENAFEPVHGDGCEYFGMRELLDKARGMKTTFDPGNFTNQMQSRALPTASAVLEYACNYKEQIPYFHIKTTLDYNLLPYVDHTKDFDMAAIFVEMANVQNVLFCLELPASKTLTDTKENIIESVEFLQKQGLLDRI
jgi:sugar phosphate isomerase/epimerase